MSLINANRLAVSLFFVSYIGLYYYYDFSNYEILPDLLSQFYSEQIQRVGAMYDFVLQVFMAVTLLSMVLLWFRNIVGVYLSLTAWLTDFAINLKYEFFNVLDPIGYLFFVVIVMSEVFSCVLVIIDKKFIKISQNQ